MKKSVTMCAPFNTRSGYGDHARSIYYSIMDRDDLDIKCVDVKWGTTPRNHLNPEVPRHKKLLDSFISPNNIKVQPDVYIDIRIPNEFQNPGKFNIGITAGVETDVVSAEFLMGCNKMNLIIVPSNFTAETFKRCHYDKNQEVDGKQQKVGQIELECPIEVLFEGVDTDIYRPLNSSEIKSDFTDELNNLLKEDFVYLHVGQITKGKYGEDRKNIPLMIKCFLQAFTNNLNPPALLLKINGANFSILDRKETVARIEEIKNKFSEVDTIPNVYLIHGDLTIKEMAMLYNNPKIKGFVSCTHGEGFGRPLLEASCCGLPVIASKWSGQMDFLNDKESLMINGHLGEIPDSQVWEPIVVKPGRWYNVNEADVIRKFRMFYKKFRIINKKGKRLGRANHRKFSLTNMAKKFNSTLDEILKSIPNPVALNLPKLKKVKDDKSQSTIKLPKLKKVN